MVEERELEKCNFRNFTDAVTYIPNFTEIGKTFLDGLTAGTPPSSVI